MSIGKTIYTLEEGENLSVFLKELDDWFVKAGHLFVLLIATRIMSGTAVEDIAATIAGLVLGDALLVREAEDADDES